VDGDESYCYTCALAYMLIVSNSEHSMLSLKKKKNYKITTQISTKFFEDRDVALSFLHFPQRGNLSKAKVITALRSSHIT
jgi:hypothetical protein